MLSYQEFRDRLSESLEHVPFHEQPDDTIHVTLASGGKYPGVIRRNVLSNRGKTHVNFEKGQTKDSFKILCKDLDGFTNYVKSLGYTPAIARNMRLDGMNTANAGMPGRWEPAIFYCCRAESWMPREELSSGMTPNWKRTAIAAHLGVTHPDDIEMEPSQEND